MVESEFYPAGQRSEIARYEVPWVASLSAFGIRMINNDFHIDDI